MTTTEAATSSHSYSKKTKPDADAHNDAMAQLTKQIEAIKVKQVHYLINNIIRHQC